MSDGCEVPGGTSSSASLFPWQLRRTTARSRTALHGARRQPPGPGRWRSARRTTRHGDRRLLHQGRGQASSRSLGRRGVTAACGTPRRTHLSSWWRRSQLLRLTASTLPRSPSSQTARWKPGGRAGGEGERETGEKGEGEGNQSCWNVTSPSLRRTSGLLPGVTT